jgi:HD-GYP domain-containing protein (c-di-GMP phosphodiesterase class II)
MSERKVIRYSGKFHKKLDQLKKLANINVTLNSTIDLDKLIKFIISSAAELLECEAVSILLYSQEKSCLYFTESSTSDVTKLTETCVPLQGSLAGAIFLENRPLIINNVKRDPRHFPLAAQQVNFKTHSLLGVPMRTHDKITGVLEALNKKKHIFTQDDLEILQVIASQAAVAIQNAKLVRDLQDAYNSTLEGWSNALDLRDEETHGHALRVTEMTLDLAKEIGISGDQLSSFRQGALLHDIGKMGVPDNILRKPGPLTEAEWEIMRQHPDYAYKLLSPISYLRPALDIPYCHHEKWNGTGYPRGLHGEDIPLSARVFSIVDVWDALSSHRAYREPWPKEKTLEYIQSQASISFDPKVVEAFLRLINRTD